jgi:hypothetical protein
MSKTTGARRRSLVTRREVARKGHTSSLNRLYASLRNPTSTLSFPQYARLLSRLTSYTLLLRTLDSIQQSKHDRLLDTVLRTHEQRIKKQAHNCEYVGKYWDGYAQSRRHRANGLQLWL